MTLEVYLELNKLEDVPGIGNGPRTKTFKDTSGKHHSVQCMSKGVPVDAVAVSDATFGVCAKLEPSTFLAVSSGDLMSNDVTVEAWVYCDERAGCGLTFEWLRGALQSQLRFVLREHNLNLWMFRSSKGEAVFIDSDPPINTWCHLAATIQEGKGTLYLHDLKGNLIGHTSSGGFPAPPNIGPVNPAADLDRLHISSSSSLRVSHVRVYKSALSQSDIKRDIASDLRLKPELQLHLELNYFGIELFEGKKFIQDATGKHSVQMRGSIPLVPDGTFGMCAVLDPANCFSVPSFGLSNDVVTVGAWLYVDERPCSLLFMWHPTNGTPIMLGFNMQVSGQNSRIELVVNLPRKIIVCTIPHSPPSFNAWYHLAGVIVGEKATFYLHDLNGKCVGQASADARAYVEIPALNALNADLVIQPSEPLKMAHIRVYKGALTQEEIEWDIASDNLADRIDRIVGDYYNEYSKDHIKISKVDRTTLVAKFRRTGESVTLKTTKDPKRLAIPPRAPGQGIGNVTVVWKGAAVAVSEIRMPHDSPDCIYTPDNSAKIDHIFVLMLENRSFDHMFGALGLRGPDAVTGEVRNADAQIGMPGRAKEKFDGLALNGGPKDPNHEFDKVVTQLCGKGAPAYDPNKLYPPINNSGFADDYATVAGEAEKNDVMQSYEEDQIPALSKLAKNFAVCDSWFSSMPGPTTPNRFFAIAATSGGLDHTASETETVYWSVVNKPGATEYPGFDANAGFKFKNGTIFQRLGDNNWSIYVDMKSRPLVVIAEKKPEVVGPTLAFAWLSVVALPWAFAYTIPVAITATVAAAKPINIDKLMNMSLSLSGISAQALKPYSQFAADLQAGIAAKYTFIEPDYGEIFAQTYEGGNSQHPVDDVKNGDQLIASVYNAIRSSSLWKKSMLIITWDEHGGFYDHVPPPKAVAPGDSVVTDPVVGQGPINKNGFLFDRYGVRVPAVIVSPWIEKGVIDGRIYDHASIPKTVEKRFGLEPMTARDSKANSLLPLLSLRVPREDCPLISPQTIVQRLHNGYIIYFVDAETGWYLTQMPGDHPTDLQIRHGFRATNQRFSVTVFPAADSSHDLKIAMLEINTGRYLRRVSRNGNDMICADKTAIDASCHFSVKVLDSEPGVFYVSLRADNGKYLAHAVQRRIHGPPPSPLVMRDSVDHSCKWRLKV